MQEAARIRIIGKIFSITNLIR